MYKKMLLAIIVVTVGAAAVLNLNQIQSVISGLGVGGISGPTASAAPAQVITTIAAPTTIVVRGCDDATTSSPSSFAQNVKDSIVSAVGSFVPPKPTVIKDGVQARAGLDLTARLVTTSPLETGAPFYEVKIPSIVGLPARPSLTSSGATDPGGSYDQWTAASKQWSAEYDAALAAVPPSVALLQGIDLSVSADSLSGISACMSSLVANAQPGIAANYFLASDLQETVATQSTGSFSGAPLIVIQSCPSGDVQTCDSANASFAAWATSRGAGTITTVRPEVADAAIRTLIGEPS